MAGIDADVRLALFIGHGTQKWFGWFGGRGIGIALGAFTPASAAALVGSQVTTIRTVHFKNGFWSTAGGYEYNLTIIAALLLIVDGGPGALSVDGAFGLEETGTGVALAALAAGVLGSTVSLAAAKAAHQKATAEAPTPAAS